MSRTLDTSTDPTLWALGGPRLAIEDGALVLGGGSVAAEAITQRRRRPGAGTDAPPPSDHLTEADLRTIEDEPKFGPEYDEPGIPPMEPTASDPTGDDSPDLPDSGGAE